MWKNRFVVLLTIVIFSFMWREQSFCQSKYIDNKVAEVSVRKTPYLIYTGVNTEYLLLWQLNSTKTSVLKWGTDTTYSAGNIETTEYGNDHQHKYKFTGLLPGTKYYYDVFVNSAHYKGDFYSAPVEDAKSVKFVAYGDSRSYPERHEKVAKQILKLFASDPEYQSIVAFPGDVAKRGEEDYWTNDFFNPQYNSIKKMLGSAGYQIAIGNHEDDGKVFNKYYPYSFVKHNYWAFDYGPVHFVMLDQYLSSYSTGSEQMKWFENELKTTKKEWKIVVMHKVGYTVGHHSIDEKAIKSILPLCEKYGVQVMIGGHNHLYARAFVNGVYCITTGGATSISGPGDVDPNTPYIEKVAHKNHFCKINIEEDKLFFDAIDYEGNTIDEFMVSLNETLCGLNIGVEGLGKITVTPDSSYYHAGTEVTLTALPDSGWEFESWSGDLSGTTNPINFKIDKTKDITAIFRNPNGGFINVQINNTTDDAEEKVSTGKVSLKSSDLELVVDASEQIVGMRFTNIKIPQRATITKAYIQFTTDEKDKGTCSLTINGEASDNAKTFNTTTKNISSRKTTSASVNWNPEAWNKEGESSVKQQTPELKTIVQTIVDRSGWKFGNSMAIIISGSGVRTAESYNGSASDAAKLHVEYSTTTDISKEKNKNIPVEYEFISYPNPFNPATKIAFTTPKSGRVKITIYNILGCELAKLVDDYFESGSYNFVWNAKFNTGDQLPSGVYIARIEAGIYAKSIKMMLLK